MKIAIDIDGVLANFEGGFAPILHKIQSGVKFDPLNDPIPVWDWPAHYGFTAETLGKAWREVEVSKTFWSLLYPTKNAYGDAASLQKLVSEGHDIYFVTSRPGAYVKQQTEQWLRMLGIANPTVLICWKKGDLCKALSIDVLVDDKIENCQQAIEAGTKAILFKQLYNESAWAQYETCTTVREALHVV